MGTSVRERDPYRAVTREAPGSTSAHSPVAHGPVSVAATLAPARTSAQVPGAVLAGGRYRLRERFDSPGDVQFWSAQDLMMGRDVALTRIANPQGAGIASHVARTTGRAAARLSTLAVDALAGGLSGAEQAVAVLREFREDCEPG